MIEVAALTSGIASPARRFRFAQLFQPLAARGIIVQEHRPRIEKYADLPDQPLWRIPKLWGARKVVSRLPSVLRTWTADVTWLERELYAGRRSVEPLVHRPYVFDVDDAIWLLGPEAERGMARIARSAAAVFAGNSYIAEWAADYASEVRLVPTVVDPDHYVPRLERLGGEGRFVVGWIGTSSNFRYLAGIRDALERFLVLRDAELLIVADRPPRLALDQRARVRFVTWSAEAEVACIQEMNVGIMPLDKGRWAQGKCGLKMLQYMSCGIPSVVTPVGANLEVAARGAVALLAEGTVEWLAALETLYADECLRARLGKEAREVVKEHYSVARVVPEVAAVFATLAGHPAAANGGVPT